MMCDCDYDNDWDGSNDIVDDDDDDNDLVFLSGISFTPREVGDYLVNVYRHGNHIHNSPFKIYVGETEVGSADRVKVYGKGLSHGMANEDNEFFVNTKDAGRSTIPESQ